MTDPAPHRPVALLSDFGDRDAYVAIMKARLLESAPKAPLIDISHRVAPGDVRTAALVLETAAQDFRQPAIFLAVVDPGVGSDRRALLVRWREHLLIGPDNGLFTPFLDGETASADPPAQAREIDSGAWGGDPPGDTFHGRDVFAPVAGKLAAGNLTFEQAGPAVEDALRLGWPKPRRSGDNRIHVPILHADHFGNLLSALTRPQLRAWKLKPLGVQAGFQSVIPWGRTFSSVPPGKPLAYWDSSGRLGIAVNRDSARDRLKLKPGDAVTLLTEAIPNDS